MTTFIIITTNGLLIAEGSRWTRSSDGDDVYVYPDSDATDPVAEVDADEFIGIFDRAVGDYAFAGDDRDHIKAILEEYRVRESTSE